ncbi:hypothetical protein L7F22_020758 [Adiantum nelumboides]|nr:hypothetical protein [Adiantum nelumboides]
MKRKLKEQLSYEDLRFQRVNNSYNTVKNTLTALLQNQERVAASASTFDSAVLNTLNAFQEELKQEKLQRQLIVSGMMDQTVAHEAKEEFDRMYQEKIQNLLARDMREYMDHEEDYEASYAMEMRLLDLLASGDAALKEAGIPSHEKPFSQWLRMHVYWWQLRSNAWVDSEREETGIYPEDWIDDLQGMDAWRDYPWFLDYADGEFPNVEEGAYHAHHKKVKEKDKSSSATINQPKDAHSPSTAKGRPPRTAKGRPSTLKKRPRHAVSESSKSLEKQFELLSREDVEDSKHVDSEQQQPDSRWSSPSRRSRGLQDIHRLLGSLLYTGQMDPNARLGGVRLMWVDLPTHYKVDAGFGENPLWNVFTDGIVQSVATLIVATFVRDLDGPLPVPFYDRRAGDIATGIDGYEADSDMLREPLQESSWTLDTSGAAFLSM